MEHVSYYCHTWTEFVNIYIYICFFIMPLGSWLAVNVYFVCQNNAAMFHFLL